jgi:hypothetical protein
VCSDPADRMVSAMTTRRRLLAVGLGLAVSPWMSQRGTASALRAESDNWFWEAIERIEERGPVGGPSAGVIENSRYGVEANRARRIHPSEHPPSVTDFYLRVYFAPEREDNQGWDVGFVWRIDERQGGVWWTIDDGARWSLTHGVWGLATRAGEVRERGALCAPIHTPVQIQALVIDGLLACAVNGGGVRTAVPERDTPGQVGVVANLADRHTRPDGGTPYSGLTLREVKPDDVPSLPPVGRTPSTPRC